jgi:hypothetical protein
MIIRNLIPAIVMLTIASGGALASSGIPPTMANGPVRSAGAAARFQQLDRIDPAIVGRGPCSALQAKFDRDVNRPDAHHLHVVEAAALRREGAALCRQGDVMSGTTDLETAIATLLARPVL